MLAALACASTEDKWETNEVACRGSESTKEEMMLGNTASREAASGRFSAQLTAAWGSRRAHCRETFWRSDVRPSFSLACKAKAAAERGSASPHCEIILANAFCRTGPAGSRWAQLKAVWTSLLPNCIAMASAAS